MAFDKNKFMTCTVNGKYSFPFMNLTETAERNSHPSNMRLSLFSQGLTLEEVDTIKQGFTNSFLELAGVDNEIKSIKCETPFGQVMFNSKMYSYLSSVEVRLDDMTNGTWSVRVSFLYTNPNNGID